VNVHPGIIFWIMMILGMVWQFIISLIILSQELKTLSWSSLKQRLWLNKPLNPRTKKPNARLFWWLVPCLVFSFLTSFALSDSLDYSVVSLFSSSSAPHYTQIENLKSPEFIGVWWVLGIALFSSLFNYFLGEELFFRGVLLPKMEKRFGRFAWLVNAILFGLYHVHKPWNLPSIILSNFAISWPAQRYRSNWMAVMVHGVEGIVLLVMVSLVVLGIGV
jgi:membrane protease YdiL (CAAX protease family)